jgi:twinkle protein
VSKTFADFGIETHGKAGEFDTTCPQCSSTRKKKSARCLSVNADKGTFKCHHCGWAGGLGDGERRYEPPWRKPVYRRPEPIASKPLDPIVQWFGDRGIQREVLERNRVTPVTVYMPQVEDHVGAVAFPYYRGDELVNVKYRDREKNFRMETGAERVLYGLNDVQPERCVIVEGEIDKLSVEVAGIVSCVSVPDGAPAPNTKDYSSKFTFLEADEDAIGAVQEWILAVDADEPGQRLCDELARRLGREKCKRVKWPQDCKDANDVLMSFGAAVLRECIDNAEPYPIDGVFTHQDMSPRVSNLFVRGWDKPVSTGWDELDRFYRVRPGELSIVTGIPSSGKSNWVDALAINLASIHGWRIGMFSPENQPVEDHIARMIEKRVGAPFYDGPTPRMSREEMDAGMAWVMDHVYWYLPPNEETWTVGNLLEVARSLVRQKGIQGFIIDPWNELECLKPKGMTETDYIGDSLRRIRQFARQNAVHVWIVAHPMKLERNKNGEYPVPTMYDIAGSAHWRNKADNGLCVWRDFNNESAAVSVFVQKIRFRQNGKTGEAQFRYKPATATYSEFGVGGRR